MATTTALVLWIISTRQQTKLQAPGFGTVVSFRYITNGRQTWYGNITSSDKMTSHVTLRLSYSYPVPVMSLCRPADSALRPETQWGRGTTSSSMCKSAGWLAPSPALGMKNRGGRKSAPGRQHRHGRSDHKEAKQIKKRPHCQRDSATTAFVSLSCWLLQLSSKLLPFHRQALVDATDKFSHVGWLFPSF